MIGAASQSNRRVSKAGSVHNFVRSLYLALRNFRVFLLRAMRPLTLAARPWPVTRRQWTCNVCLHRSSIRYNSSTAPDPLPVAVPTEQKPEQPELPDYPMFKIAETVRPEGGWPQTHLRNKGTYYVTTPIFYVNGGPNTRFPLRL
jgi:hypothetical protein